MIIFNKRLLGIAIGILVLLIVPFVAMQFTDEVNWTILDFVVAGGLLLFFGFLIEFVIRKVKKSNYRIAFVLGILVTLVLIWLELAVGIFGTPFSGS